MHFKQNLPCFALRIVNKDKVETISFFWMKLQFHYLSTLLLGNTDYKIISTISEVLNLLR